MMEQSREGIEEIILLDVGPTRLKRLYVDFYPEVVFQVTLDVLPADRLDQIIAFLTTVLLKNEVECESYVHPDSFLLDLLVMVDHAFKGGVAEVPVSIGVCLIDHFQQFLFGGSVVKLSQDAFQLVLTEHSAAQYLVGVELVLTSLHLQLTENLGKGHVRQDLAPSFVSVHYSSINSPDHIHYVDMFSGLKRGLRSIDFYQAVPSELSEGTVSGACISIVSIVLLVVLTITSIIEFTEPKTNSDLIIDQKHLAQPLQVHIDIEFPHYPCSILSLDVENILKVHLVNINQNIDKILLPDGTPYIDAGLNDHEKVENIINHFRSKKGCRMKGVFEVDRVPGNFHFSCHGYSNAIPTILGQGISTIATIAAKFDMSHTIHDLHFGEKDYSAVASNSLSHYSSERRIEDQFMGISYTYFLDIIEKNQVDENNEKGKESYVYTVRVNEVILAQIPLVFFKYETNPMTVLTIHYYEEWHKLIIELVGILGGIFTVFAIIDHLLHSSIHFLLEKQRLNKLR